MVRIIFYNIQYTTGQDGSLKNYLKVWKPVLAPKKVPEQIACFLREQNPDIVGFAEIDLGSFRVRNNNLVRYFRESLEFPYSVSNIKYLNSEKSMVRKLPYFSKQANSIISKHKLHFEKFHYFSCGMKRLVIETQFEFKKKNINVFLVHLALSKKERLIQLKELSEMLNCCENEYLLMGDFNVLKSGFDEFDEFFELCDRLIKPQVADDYLTYPAFKPKKALDFIFTSKGLRVNTVKVLDSQYSDHLPVQMDIDFRSFRLIEFFKRKFF